jgi:hypothetical protein
MTDSYEREYGAQYLGEVAGLAAGDMVEVDWYFYFSCSCGFPQCAEKKLHKGRTVTPIAWLRPA